MRVAVVALLVVTGGLAAEIASAPAPPAPFKQRQIEVGVAGAAHGSAPFTRLVCPFPLPSLEPTRPFEHCNLRASAQTGPANEIDLAMDSRDPRHLVAVAKAYNYSRTMPPVATSVPSVVAIPDQLLLHRPVITSYATTWDGGMSWTEGYLQGSTPWVAGLPLRSSSEQGSDPVVEFLPDGTVLAVTLRVTEYPVADSLPVWRSADGGATFEPLGSAFDGGPDKEWMAVDPETGAVHLVTDDPAGAGGTWYTQSTDRGLIWRAPLRLPDECCHFPSVAVGPAGVVYVAGSRGIFTRSSDDGLTWSPPTSIPRSPDCCVPGYGIGSGSLQLFRTLGFENLAASHTDGLVVDVWFDRRYVLGADVPPPLDHFSVGETDVFMTRSGDGGTTWETPRRISDEDGLLGAQFMPQVALSPNGRDLHVAWMDQRHDPSGQLVEVYYRHSPDGGITWDPEMLVSDAPFLADLSHHQNPLYVTPLGTGGIFVGDYIGLQASDDRAVIAFPDTRYGRADVFVATVV